jgi:hypothetical protein
VKKREAEKSPGGEQIHWHHCPIASSLLDQREEQHDRERRDTGGHRRSGPSAPSRADRQRPCERNHPESRQRRAQGVQRLILSVLVRLEIARGEHDGTGRKRQVYKKDGAPAAQVD